MEFVRINRFLVFFVVLFATNIWAIDCIDYTGDPHPLCAYERFEGATLRGVALFVVPEGAAPNDLSSAIPNVDFYVYAPANPDTVEYALQPNVEGAPVERVENMKAVHSGEAGYRVVAVSSLYPKYNVEIGTAVTEQGEPALVRIFNFYAPALEFCLDELCEQVISSRALEELDLEVGDTLKVFVRAYIPVGPDTYKTDETLTKSFYIQLDNASENVRFLSQAKDELPKRPLGYQLDIYNGWTSFFITATDVVMNPTFTVNAYPDFTAEGDTNFILTEEFPAGLHFTYPGLPSLDSAFIFDSDGDGKGDSIRAYFGGDMEFVSVDEFAYNWPSGEKFKAHGGGVSHKGNEFVLTNVQGETSNDLAEGILKATLVSPSVSRPVETETPLVDKIGPVIYTASIVKGAGATDTLILRFNKEIDSSWSSGEGFLLNGNPIDLKAVKKEGDTWTFTVPAGNVFAGDSISIAAICKSSACPDGVLKTADGNKAGVNLPAEIKNAGRLYADDENNGFYDTNGDGRMDSATVAFENPLTPEDLKNLELTLYWLNSKGEVVAIELENLDSLEKKGVLVLNDDRTILGIEIDPEKYDIQKMLTAIDSTLFNEGEEYGYVKVVNAVTIDNKEEKEITYLSMNDKMAPQIATTFLKPESFQKMEPDVLTLTFSEAIDFKNIENLDSAFLLSNDENSWDFAKVASYTWSSDGRSVVVRFENGAKLEERKNPSDYIRLNENFKAFKDKEGNGIFEEPAVVMLEGDPRVLAQTTSLATLDFADKLSNRKDFTVRFVPRDSTLDDEMKMSLGVLMNVSFATIMKESERGENELNLENIGLSWEMYIYTNLGAYVASSSGRIMCDDSYFLPEGKQGSGTGNCLENPKKLYFRWNMRSSDGKKVGIGVYLAKFKVRVFGAKDSFEYERFFNWGVKSGKNGLDLKTLDK